MWSESSLVVLQEDAMQSTGRAVKTRTLLPMYSGIYCCFPVAGKLPVMGNVVSLDIQGM